MTLGLLLSSSLLIRFHLEHKADGAWPSFALRESHTRFVDYMANCDIPPPSEARARPENIGRDRRCHSPVVDCRLYDVIYTISSLPGGRWRCRNHFLRTCLASSWGHTGEWTPRIQQFVYDMQEDPNVVLAEGTFPFNQSVTACTFMKLRYSPQAPEHEKYTIVGTVFRLGECLYTFSVSAFIDHRADEYKKGKCEL